MSDTKALIVRLPEDMHREFKLACVEDRKVMNDVIVEQIGEYLKQRKQRKPKARR